MTFHKDSERLGIYYQGWKKTGDILQELVIQKCEPITQNLLGDGEGLETYYQS